MFNIKTNTSSRASTRGDIFPPPFKRSRAPGETVRERHRPRGNQDTTGGAGPELCAADVHESNLV